MPPTELPLPLARAIEELYTSLDTATHYELLSLTPDADEAAVKQAYYAVSRKWHPDHFSKYKGGMGIHADYVESIFVAMNQASYVLRDADRRKAYDRTLREANRLPKPSGSGPASSAEPTRPSAEPSRPRRWSSASTTPASPGSIRERLQARAPTSPRSSASLRQKAEARVVGQVREQLIKARTFYDQAVEDHAAGRVIKAAGAIELALQYDPSNKSYQELRDILKAQARTIRVQTLVQQGEQAESFQQLKQAIQCYRDAIELEPDQGLPYFRLARLMQQEEHSERELLNLLRMAVLKAPNDRDKKIEYRLALAELYVKLGLRLNARREFEAILALDSTHANAKEALKTL